MDSRLDRPLSRRDFLKITASLAAVGLTTSLTPDLLYARPKADLKGVTIYYWNMVGIQNPIVRKISASIIKAFEQRTGAKVKTTWETYGSIIGPKYRTNF
ncbi:twin-arginine translocation signal domain-containing protein, partial [bacterium]|nr:twin-arginine translocation signal domain-containing protein [bacterium]